MEVLGILAWCWVRLKGLYPDRDEVGRHCFEGPSPCPLGLMSRIQDYHFRSSLGIPKVPTGPWYQEEGGVRMVFSVHTLRVPGALAS